jgi:hypothetical protein
MEEQGKAMEKKWKEKEDHSKKKRRPCDGKGIWLSYNRPLGKFNAA